MASERFGRSARRYSTVRLVGADDRIAVTDREGDRKRESTFLPLTPNLNVDLMAVTLTIARRIE